MKSTLLGIFELPEIAMDIRRAESESAVIVEIDCRVGTEFYSATGASKCDKHDIFDPQIGYELAFSRALKDLARTIGDTAQARVRVNDKIREAREDTNLYALIHGEVKKSTSWNKKHRPPRS